MWLYKIFVITLVHSVISSDTTKDTTVKVENGVALLTSDNFNSFISENEHVFVYFTSPFCDRCDNIDIEYVKLVEELAVREINVKLAKINGNDESKLAEAYNVQEFPALKFFRNGTVIDYIGPEKAGEIVKFLYRKTVFPATEIQNADDAEEFIKSNPVVIIGFFDDLNKDGAEAYLFVANAVHDYPFGITSDKDVYDKYNVKSGSIILFKDFDEKVAVFDGKVEEDEIRKFFAIHSTPLIIDFNRDAARLVFSDVFGYVRSQLLIFVSEKAGHYVKYIHPAEYEDVAKQFRDKVLFISINVDQPDHEQIMQFFEVKNDEVPTMRLIRMDKEHKSKFIPKTTDISADNIRAFVQDYLDAKIKQHLRTQELPENWNKNPIKVLVGSNFDEVVFNSGKDVLVNFYSPRCGVCKVVEPIYKKIGNKYKDSNTIIIAKIDATLNELAHTKLTTHPTFKLYKKGNKTGIVFHGRPSYEKLVKFVESGGDQEIPTVTMSEKGDTLPREEL